MINSRHLKEAIEASFKVACQGATPWIGSGRSFGRIPRKCDCEIVHT